jgi:hypothetical protein
VKEVNKIGWLRRARPAGQGGGAGAADEAYFSLDPVANSCIKQRTLQLCGRGARPTTISDRKEALRPLADLPAGSRSTVTKSLILFNKTEKQGKNLGIRLSNVLLWRFMW